MPACPSCTCAQTVKDGRIHTGKQRFKCRACGRAFQQYLAAARWAISL